MSASSVEPPTTRRCTDCKRTLPVEEFTRNRSLSSGLLQRCRSCNSAAATAWNRANKDRVNERQRTEKRREQRRADARRAALRDRATIRAFVCPRCGALPGVTCRNPSGVATVEHRGRGRD